MPTDPPTSDDGSYSSEEITTYIYDGGGMRIAAVTGVPETCMWFTYDTDGHIVARGYGPHPSLGENDDTPPDQPHIVE